jgi:glycosyltransferase involved in cell wall biosynthesis
MSEVLPTSDVFPRTPPPDVSVVIPTFNRRRFLPSAIASARAQTLTDIEIIVVDDGSTDGTAGITAALAASDPRMRVVRQDNRGPSAARNVGLACATAQWVAFLDDDDLWHPDFLSQMLAFVEQHGLQAGACLAVGFSAPPEVHEALAVLAEPARFSVAPWPPRPPGRGVIALAELLLRPLAPVNSAFLAVEAVRDLGGFDEKLIWAEDYDLWLRLAHLQPVRVLNKRLALCRVHPSRLTSSLGRMANQTRTVLESFIATHPGVERLAGRWPLARRLATLCREEAYAALTSGDAAAAKRAAAAAVRRDPLVAKAWGYLLVAPWPGLYRRLRRLLGRTG